MKLELNSQTIIFHFLSIFQFIDFRIHEKRPFELTKLKLLQLLWTTCIFGRLIIKLFDLNYDWGKKGVVGVGESACSYKLNVTSKIWLPIMVFIKSILVSFSCIASLKCLRFTEGRCILVANNYMWKYLKFMFMLLLLPLLTVLTINYY